MSRGPRYLKLRHQTWYFQMHVPEEVRRFLSDEPGLNGAKIIKTTGERDVGLAQAIALRWAGEYKRKFNDLRMVSDTSDASPREVYKAKLAALRAGRFGVWEGEAPPAEEGEEQEAPEDRRLALEIALLIEQAKKDKNDDHILSPHDRATLDALYDYQRERSGRKARKRDEYGLAFSTAAEKCMKQKARELREQSKAQYESTQRLFADHVNDKAIRLVTKKDAADFLDEVSALHPNWGRGRDVKKMSLAEIKAKYGDKGEGLSNKTINRYLTALSLVWDWAKERGEVAGESPFSGLFRKVNSKTSKTYTHFTPEELKKLFAEKPDKRTLREVSLVALYSGMRLNEVCALAWGDIKKEDGVWCFDITAAKSEAGVRVVPVHSKLMWLLERRSQDPAEQVWPELTQGGPDNKFSWKFTAEFTRFRRDRGVTDGDGRYRRAFHSFRKNAIRCLELAGVPQNEAAEIVGHEKVGITYRVYNPERITMEMRQRVVEKIKYPELARLV